jgi:hypothetical protein
VDAGGSALSIGWQRTQELLFRPFNLGTWFGLGLIFFLEQLLEGFGGYNNFRSPGGGSGPGGGSPAGTVHDLKDALDRVRGWVGDNLGVIVGIGAAVFLLVVGLSVLFTWLGSRGEMMALRSVATGRVSVLEAWGMVKRPANAMFRFRLLVAVIGWVVTFPLLILGVLRFASLVDDGVTDLGDIFLGMAPFVVLLVVLAFVGGVIGFVARNFLAPIMQHFDCGVGEAWRRFKSIANAGAIGLYVLVRIGVGFVAGIAAVLVTYCTCCIGALPVLHQTIMAPFFVFERAYTLAMFRAAGPEYENMLQAPPPPWGGYGPGTPPPGGGFGPPGAGAPPGGGYGPPPGAGYPPPQGRPPPQGGGYGPPGY